MNPILHDSPYRLMRWSLAVLAGGLAVLVLNSGVGADPAPRPGAAATPAVPLVQQFEDVPDTNPFATFVNALFQDNIISGYTCGGPDEPCVPPGNRPYYRPNNTVTRAQMAKFVENGRRNIDQAIGESLALSTTLPTAPLIARTGYGFGEAVNAYCDSPGPCFAVRGHADQDGNWAGYFGSDGAGGVYAEQDDDNGSAVRGVSRGVDAEAGYFHAYGNTSYAGWFESDNYRGIYATGDPSFYGLYMNTAGSPYSAYFDGDITVTGNCVGCMRIDIVQNVGSSALEAGDVVTLVGSGPAVLGESPVLLVRKATGAYDTAVAGIVGGAVYVPDAATRAAYLAQEHDRQAAQQAQQQALEQAMSTGDRTARPAIPMPEARISDREGTVHLDDSQASIAPQGYARMLASGAVQSLKVDAGFGAIHAGDLLVSSPTAGYAMKADDKLVKFGSVLGKALGDLDSGTGTIPVLITLK